MDRYLKRLKEIFGEDSFHFNKLSPFLEGSEMEREMNFVRNGKYIEDFLEFPPGLFLPIKGLSLLLKGYYSPKERQMNDMDLLVRPELFFDGLEILRKMGYRQLGRFNRYSYEISLVRDDFLKVDLHKNLFYPHLYRIDIDEIFKNLKEISFSGKKLFLLDDTFEILILVFSIINNGFNVPLLSFYDLIRVIKRGDVDLNLLREISLRWGILRGLVLVNSLMYEVFGENFFELKIKRDKRVKELLEILSKPIERKGIKWRKREFRYKFSLLPIKNQFFFFLYYFFRLKILSKVKGNFQAL